MRRDRDNAGRKKAEDERMTRGIKESKMSGIGSEDIHMLAGRGSLVENFSGMRRKKELRLSMKRRRQRCSKERGDEEGQGN